MINKAVKLATDIANNDKHGYCQTNRWSPDFDCSSIIIHCLNSVGLENKATFTGNMYTELKKIGFKDVKKDVDTNTGRGIQSGDIVLEPNKHTFLCIGNNKIVEASLNEKGTTTGGKTGDQTGEEIKVRNYYKNDFKYVLRLNTKSKDTLTLEQGKVYTVSVDNLNVRYLPSTIGGCIPKLGLTLDGQKKSNSKGQLKKGTKVTALTVSTADSPNVWIRIPSGWVCALYKGERYIK